MYGLDNPFGMEEPFWSKEMLLLAWQQEHQPLDEAQKALFLENINVDQILTYRGEVISRLLPLHKKLDSLRKALHEEVNREIFLIGESGYVEITSEDLGMSDPEPWATTLGELGLE
jgi:hypothetical protein